MPRYESKFLLKNNNDLFIEKVLDKFLKLDSNCTDSNNYTVHSLYFDDYLDSAFHDVDAGNPVKIKYRIRRYNNDIDKYKLEIKKKINGELTKDFCYLQKNEVLKIINNDTSSLFWNTQNEVLRRFLISMQTKILRPKVIVTYDRIPYVNPVNNLRITIDKNIRYSNDISNFVNKYYLQYMIFDKILEVKFNDFIPKDIRKILSDFDLFQVAFSKYYNARYECQKLGVII